MRPHSPTSVGLIVLLALVCVSPSAIARRGGVPLKPKPAVVTARMEFQALYSKTDDAFENKDLDGNLAYHDPDFVEVQKSGDELDIGEIRYRLSSWLDLAKTIRSNSSVVSANVQGVSGTVMVRLNLTMVLINPDTRARATFVERVVSKDSWSRRSDGWMLKRSQIISELATNNGHKVFDRNNPFKPTPKATDDDDNLAPEPEMDTPGPNNGDNG